jgi:hypothetical protein
MGSQTEFTSGPGEKCHYQTDAQKMSSILNLIGQYRWSIGKFLLLDEKAGLGGSAVKSFLSGASDVHVAQIVNLMYSHQHSNPPSRHEEHLHHFSPDVTPNTIRYAAPAISSWALQLVLDVTTQKAKYLCSMKEGLRVCASRQAAHSGVGVADFMHNAIY